MHWQAQINCKYHVECRNIAVKHTHVLQMRYVCKEIHIRINTQCTAVLFRAFKTLFSEHTVSSRDGKERRLHLHQCTVYVLILHRFSIGCELQQSILFFWGPQKNWWCSEFRPWPEQKQHQTTQLWRRSGWTWWWTNTAWGETDFFFRLAQPLPSLYDDAGSIFLQPKVTWHDRPEELRMTQNDRVSVCWNW